MTDENRKQVLRHQVRQVRTHLLEILNWIESEIDHTELTHHEYPPPTDTMASVVDMAHAEKQEPLTDRHYWILTQLGLGVKLTRKHVMEEFGYSVRHAKRILGILTERDMIKFQRTPGPGCYVLCMKITHRNHSSIERP
ncbi:MAG: hypothetical protein KAV82_16820 [Phycisphaerae bacterium]|nr:hypothetical protein [Phycisphaerae bacterium]